MKPKRHRISTLEDMGRIPLDRIDAFLADLRAFLLIDCQRKRKDTFEWIDDGDVGISEVVRS